jgi:hypothetical protein
VQRCGGVAVRRCGGAAVRQCGGAAVRQCGGAAVRRYGGDVGGCRGVGVRTGGSVQLQWLRVARGRAQLRRLRGAVRGSGVAVRGCGGRGWCRMVVLRTVDGGIDGQ